VKWTRPVSSAAPRSHTRGWYADRTDPGHHLAFRQVPVTNHAAHAGCGLQSDMLGEELGNLSLDRLGKQDARSVAQHLGERVGK
jgi:hypothetical protein